MRYFAAMGVLAIVAGGRPAYAQEWILYMNPDGGRYLPGNPNEAATNRSSIVQNHVGSAVDIRPYPFGGSSWQFVLGCVRDLYADFDIRVTDEDPGDIPHIETVVGGSPGDLNLMGGMLGIAVTPCEPVYDFVQFAFAEAHAGFADRDQLLCETVAQESAHSFGLDHAYLCEDVLTYLHGCGPKEFVDADVSCGEVGPRPCLCGGSRQNSYRHLLDWLGPRSGEDPEEDAPGIAITSPPDGATVPPGFDVQVDVTGPVDSVEIWIDSRHITTRGAGPWVFETPDELQDGFHSIEAVVFSGDSDLRDEIRVHVSADAPPLGGGGGGGGGSSSACRAAPSPVHVDVLVLVHVLVLGFTRRTSRRGEPRQVL